eukprot:c2293_g1_i1.p1 GENE.c2293_g1_i1~~c2293_g1_i1.p1  ORF type:complete len:372 (+),score=61.97 c2293_g1_i1:35-1117(+)
MVLVEVRVPLPLSPCEASVGLYFTYVRETEQCITSGIKCLSHEVFEEEGKLGTVTKREYNYSHFFPKMLLLLVPSLKDVWFREESRCEFPMATIQTKSDYFGDKFRLQSQTTTISHEQHTTSKNIFGLDPARLSSRQIVEIDLLHTPNDLLADYPNQRLPPSFQHIKQSKWHKTVPPKSWSYALFDVAVTGFMMQARIEKIVCKGMLDRLHASRLASVCLYENWKNLTLYDVIAMEREFEIRAHNLQHLPLPTHLPYRSPPVLPTSPSSSAPPFFSNVELSTMSMLQLSRHSLRIRKHVKEWYLKFTEQYGRNPTDPEVVHHLKPFYRQSRSVEKTLRSREPLSTPTSTESLAPATPVHT